MRCAGRSTTAERIARLKQKYDAAAIDNGMRLRPGDFLDELEWRDMIDQHYTRSWLMFTYGGLLGGFFLGVLWRRAVQRDAIAGMGVGIFAMAFIVGFLFIHLLLALMVPKSLRAMVKGR